MPLVFLCLCRSREQRYLQFGHQKPFVWFLQQLPMPQKKLVLDGLWYCLCPSLNLLAPNRFGIPLTKGKRGLPSPALPPRRCYGSGEPAGDNERRSAPRKTPNTDPATEQQDVSHTEKGPHKRHARKETGVARPPKTPPALKKLSGLPTVNLEAKLQELSAKVPKIKTTMRILRILVKDRHVRPGVRHYRALILANTDAERGSPETLRGLLSEMERNGVPADSGTLHAALQVCGKLNCFMWGDTVDTGDSLGPRGPSRLPPPPGDPPNFARSMASPKPCWMALRCSRPLTRNSIRVGLGSY